MAGLTLDTGALIKLEGNRKEFAQKIKLAIDTGIRITVPTVVIAEWWRAGAGSGKRDTILRMFSVEDLTKHLAKLAGEALGTVNDSTVVDAIVMASASLRGDIVYTSDLPDLERLQEAFPDVALELA